MHSNHQTFRGAGCWNVTCEWLNAPPCRGQMGHICEAILGSYFSVVKPHKQDSIVEVPESRINAGVFLWIGGREEVRVRFLFFFNGSVW